MKSSENKETIIQSLEARIRAQQKTIDVLMDTVENYSSQGATPLELLSENLNLEQVVQRKTARLRQQGEELERALKELQHTQAQLLQANRLEAVGQLAAGIAHEINTPAQFIGFNVDFLQEAFSDILALIDIIVNRLEDLTDEDSIQMAQEITRNVLVEQDWEYLSEEIPVAIRQSLDGIGKITTIVQAMKDFAHPKSKDKEKFDLNRIIETTVIVARNEWKYSSELHTDLDPALPKISCHVDELGQAILNVLVNAAHANEEKMTVQPDDTKGTIVISTKWNDNHVRLRISDTGNGIPEEVQDRIFDPFFTTKPVGKGSGQGLAIAHNIITKKHGGSITLSSESGKGAAFYIELPIE